MLIGKSVKKIRHAKFLVNQARDESRGYYHPEIGFNYRMTNIEAGLGLAQMEKLDFLLNKKRFINKIYKQELKRLDFLRFQKEYNNSESSWWFSCVTFEKELNLKTFQMKLKEKGIPTRRLFMPVVEFPPYKKYKSGSCRNSYDIYKKGLCLPSSTVNSEESIRRVCKALKELV